jgi:nicotinamidase-related amidase
MSSLTLSPASTALILIDLQNGIAGMPLAPYSFDTILANTNRLTQALRDKGATLVFVRVAIGEVLPRVTDAPVRDPHAPPPPPEASELVAGLHREPADLLLTKRQWGAFYGTELDQQLRRRGIRTILMGGVATNFGVESTARTAFDLGYELVFVEDAMTTVSAEAQQFATQVVFPRMGRVRSTEAVLAALQA